MALATEPIGNDRQHRSDHFRRMDRAAYDVPNWRSSPPVSRYDVQSKSVYGEWHGLEFGFNIISRNAIAQ